MPFDNLFSSRRKRIAAMVRALPRPALNSTASISAGAKLDE
jgi:hypothetical protein